MSRYIDADVLIDKLPKEYLGSIVHAMINEAPTIEPKRGEWIQTSNDWIAGACGAMFYPYHCSSCGYETYDDYYGLYSFCPNCGADMREREGE